MKRADLPAEYRRFPSRWDVRPFPEVFVDATGGNPKVQKNQYLKSGALPVVDQGQDLVGGYSDDVSLAVRSELPCVLFGDHTKIFKFIDFPFALGADGVKLLQSDHLLPRFAYHYLRQLSLPGDAGYSRHFKFLKRTFVPVPPEDEQFRIADILDRADAVRRRRQEAIRLTDELLRSAFLEMFGNPVTNPKGWEVKELKHFGKIITGNTPPRLDPSNYGDAVEWIKSDNINTPAHFLTQAAEYLSEKGKKKARLAPVGSVLVTCIAGSRSSIGRAALADREVAFNQQINAVIPYEDVDPHFLYGQFYTAQGLVQAKSTDSMKGLVSKGKFSTIRFLKPPPDLQKRFGDWFRRYISLCKRGEAGDEAASNLFASLVQRAFRGEL